MKIISYSEFQIIQLAANICPTRNRAKQKSERDWYTAGLYRVSFSRLVPRHAARSSHQHAQDVSDARRKPSR